MLLSNIVYQINRMMTDSFLQVLTICPAWTLWTSETLSSQAPVQVGTCVQYHGLGGIHYQGGDQLSAGAGNMLQHMDSVDVRDTEQRNLGSSAGECLWQIYHQPNLGQWYGD